MTDRGTPPAPSGLDQALAHQGLWGSAGRADAPDPTVDGATYSGGQPVNTDGDGG